MPLTQLWPDGRPPHPTVMDWSCHGSLGWTLRQALDEMDHEDDTDNDDGDDDDDSNHHDNDSTDGDDGTLMNAATNQTQDNKVSAKGQPSGADKKISSPSTHDTSKAGPQSSQSSRSSATANTGSKHNAKKPQKSKSSSRIIKVTPQMRKAVLEALTSVVGGGGAADTKTPHSSRQEAHPPPHGILKGKIKYYQRQGSRWRYEIDQVRICRRMPLPKVRRKQERPSLWDVSREGMQGSHNNDDDEKNRADLEPSTASFELLVYNDTE